MCTTVCSLYTDMRCQNRTWLMPPCQVCVNCIARYTENTSMPDIVVQGASTKGSTATHSCNGCMAMKVAAKFDFLFVCVYRMIPATLVVKHTTN